MLHYYLDGLNPMQKKEKIQCKKRKKSNAKKGNLLQLKNTICHRVIQIYGREIKEFY